MVHNELVIVNHIFSFVLMLLYSTGSWFLISSSSSRIKGYG